MTDKEALKLALEALENLFDTNEHSGGVAVWRMGGSDQPREAIIALKEALAQPEQEPVAWLMYKGTHKDSFWLDKGDAYNFEMTPEHRWEPLYTTPPQRTEPPAWFPAVENILNEYGLQAIDFVADFKAAMKDAEQPQRTWVGLMRGVRVEGDTVVITIKGGNDAARELCGNLLNEMEARG